jgi:hypothetical protein
MTKLQQNASPGSEPTTPSLGMHCIEGAKCIFSATGKQLLDEIHVGQCEIHVAFRTLVGNVLRSGFYWPTAKSDAAELV